MQHVLCLIGVMKARKKYGVKYPTLYASEGDGVTKENCHRFNCVQRGHQNCLETLPTFLSLLLTAGLAYPRAASGAGVLYLLGRWMYFKGYSTGDPAKRMQGSLHHFALFSLVGMVILCAINIYRM
jgi:glutathione S-transferase